MSHDHLTIRPVATVRLKPRSAGTPAQPGPTPARIDGSLQQVTFVPEKTYILDVSLYPLGTQGTAERQSAFGEWVYSHGGDILSDYCSDNYAAARIRVLGRVVTELITTWRSISLSSPPVLKGQ